ncbi:DUF6214 family protein [Streptomyces sp. BBFR2]|uniref:DUF6214 family protein n=1 Tax=Streptomyces sp. BBFR2 TaxID=3372854 RepID=UPI0037DA38D0
MSARLTFPDGARIDVLVTVEDDGITVEDLRADPPLPLSGLAALARWIEGPLDDACRIAIGRARRPRPVPAPATDPSAPSGPADGAARGGGARPEAHGAMPSAASGPLAGADVESDAGTATEPAARATDAVTCQPAHGAVEAARAPERAPETDSEAASAPSPAAIPGSGPATGIAPGPPADPATDRTDRNAGQPAGSAVDRAADRSARPPAAPAAARTADRDAGAPTDPGAGPPGTPATEPPAGRSAAGPTETAAPSSSASRTEDADPAGAEGRARRARAGERCKAVADAYREAQRDGRDPVAAVMSATGRSRRRALRLIAGARDAGLLTPRHHRR